jgi:hypothetical protein
MPSDLEEDFFGKKKKWKCGFIRIESR